MFAAPAAAQTPSPLAYWQYSVGQVLEPLGGPIPEWRFYFGAGVAVQPEFPGAKHYEVVPSAVIDIRYRDIAFASDGEGIGVNLLRGPTYRAGVAVAYDVGRNHTEDPRLRTLSSIDAAPEAKLFGEIFIVPVVFTAAVRQAIGGHGGLIGDLGAYIPLPIFDDLYLFLGPTVTIANTTHAKSYFGVSPREAVGSTLTSFTPHGGIESAGVGLTSAWLLSEHWIVLSQAGFQRFLGDAARSPIVEDRSQFTAGINAIYHF
jgi:outer membrane scaffolding protein for murein synthesis (MipA/OmpV family)